MDDVVLHPPHRHIFEFLFDHHGNIGDCVIFEKLAMFLFKCSESNGAGKFFEFHGHTRGVVLSINGDKQLHKMCRQCDGNQGWYPAQSESSFDQKQTFPLVSSEHQQGLQFFL